MSVMGFPSDGEIVKPPVLDVLDASKAMPTEPSSEELLLAENGNVDPWMQNPQNAATALNVLSAEGMKPYEQLLHLTVKTIGGLALWTGPKVNGYWAADGLSHAETKLLNTAISHLPNISQQHIPESPKHSGFGLAQKTEAGLGALLEAGGGAITYFSGAAANFLQLGVTGLVLGGILGGVSVAHTLHENRRYERDERPVIDETRQQLQEHIERYGATLGMITKKVMDASVFVPSSAITLSLKQIKKSHNQTLRALEPIMREELDAINEHYKEAKKKNGGRDDIFGKFDDDVNYGRYDTISDLEFMKEIYRVYRADRREVKNRKDTLVFNPLQALFDMVENVPTAAGSMQLAAIWNDNPDRPGMKTHLATIGRLQQELENAEEKWHMLSCADNSGLGMKNDHQADKIANELIGAKKDELTTAVLSFIEFRQKTMRELAKGIFGTTPQPTWTQPPNSPEQQG